MNGGLPATHRHSVWMQGDTLQYPFVGAEQRDLGDECFCDPTKRGISGIISDELSSRLNEELNAVP